MRGAREVGKNLALPIHGISFVGLAVLTSFFAYLWGGTSPNPAELLAPGLFWYSVTLLLLAYPLRNALDAFIRSIKTTLGVGVFVAYMVLHIVLYGYMLESILVSFFDEPFVAAHTSIFVTTSVFAPPSLTNAVLALWFNPWVTITVPPSFSDALSFYSLDIAFLIAILIVANIGKTRELGRLCSTRMRTRAMVLFPALGIVLGASCCLSIPILIVIGTPSLVAVTSFLWLYDVTYFLFPLFAVVILYLNLHSVEKIAANIETTATTNTSPPALMAHRRGTVMSRPVGPAEAVPC